MNNPESNPEKVDGSIITPEEIFQFHKVVSEARLTRVFMRELAGFTDDINNYIEETKVIRSDEGESPRLFLQKLPLWHALVGSTLNPEITFASLTGEELLVAAEIGRRVTAFINRFRNTNSG